MINLFHECPGCGGPLIITECRCEKCNLQLRGEFSPGLFAAFSEEQFAFIEVFLRARGNLTEVERVLGISYPTIRNKLDEINGVLEKEPAPPNNSSPGKIPATVDDLRKAILKQVSEGKLTAAEALLQLQDLGGGK